jgi:hypothetical protein
MAISRRKPQSNVGREKALTTAKQRKDNLANPADNVLTAATEGRLDIIEPLYKSKMALIGSKLADQLDVTNDVKKKLATARMFVSHFIQTFNNGIDRELFPAAHRAHYQLDGNSGRVPPLDKESDVLQWGNRIKLGDVSRLAAGGAAMAMPTAAEVDLRVTAFNTSNNNQSNKKLAFDQSQEAVVALNPEGDAVIGKIWDEAETFYNEETPASRRRKCRDWGVVYESDIPNIIHTLVKNSADSTPVAGATILIVETDKSFVTDATGNVDVKTNVIQEVTLRVSATDFVTQDVVVLMPEDEHEFSVTVALVHV